MSGPELPQPIYPPSGAGGPGGPGGHPPGGNEPPTWSVGPTGGSGGPPSSGPKISPLVWVAIGVAVLVVVAAVAVVVATGGDDDGDPEPTQPSGETTTTADDGSTTPDGGDDDLAARAEAAASMQLITQSSGPTVDCLAAGFEADPDLLAEVEADGEALDLPAASAADYAALIVGCASGGELTDEFVEGQAQAGQTDEFLLTCLADDLAVLTDAQWEELISAVVQMSRQDEVVTAIQETYNLC